MSLDRRDWILGAAALASLTGRARAEPPVAPPAPSGALPPADLKTIDLWPRKPPGGPGPNGFEQVTPGGAVTNVIKPRMVMQRPSTKPNGAAVLILGGGGYRRIGIASESRPTADWLGAHGVTSFILYYRLPNGGWPRSAPFQDAQRAMRIIRSRADEFGLDGSQIGIIGYSAGGHCAGMTSVKPDAQLYDPIDAVDSVSARPDFAGLIYPVLTMMPPNRTKISTLTLLGPNPTLRESMDMSVELQVTDDAPTTFLAQATDDPIAPIENSLLMFAALRKVHVPVELHAFRSGGHGFNIGSVGTEDRAWPTLFATWAGFTKA